MSVLMRGSEAYFGQKWRRVEIWDRCRSNREACVGRPYGELKRRRKVNTLRDAERLVARSKYTRPGIARGNQEGS